jgi:hypothetical protein
MWARLIPDGASISLTAKCFLKTPEFLLTNWFILDKLTIEFIGNKPTRRETYGEHGAG